MIITKKLCIFFLSGFLSLGLNIQATVSNVQMEMDDGGNTMAAWLDDSASPTGYNDVLAAVYPSGGSWGAGTNLSNIDGITVNNATNQKIGVNGSGDGLVVWQAYNITQGLTSLYGAFYQSGSWSSATQISANTEHVYDNFTVKTVGSNYVITWSSYSFTANSNLIRTVGDTLGTWSAPVTVAN
jgi:hypothetical protein